MPEIKMNRAMRRATKKAKLSKQKVLKMSRMDMMIRDFANINRIIRTLEEGYMDYVDGKPYFFPTNKSEKAYELCSAIEGWGHFWNLLNKDFNLGLNNNIFFRIANSLKYCSPIQKNAIKELRSTVEKQEKLYLKIPGATLRNYVTDAQIDFELEKIDTISEHAA